MSNETLIKGLISALSPAVTASAALDKAKGDVDAGSSKSIRSVSALLAKTNTPLDKATIEEVATAAATALANGSATVLKVRKSEIKLLMESRAVLPDLIKEIDRVSDDTETKVQLRTEVLRGCRVIRKEPLTTVAQVGADLQTRLTAEISAKEQCARQLTVLSKTPHLQVQGALHPMAAVLIQALWGVAEDPDGYRLDLDALKASAEAYEASRNGEIQESLDLEAVQIDTTGLEDDSDGDITMPFAEEEDEPIGLLPLDEDTADTLRGLGEINDGAHSAKPGAL